MNHTLDFKKFKYDNPNELLNLHYEGGGQFNDIEFGKQFEKTI